MKKKYIEIPEWWDEMTPPQFEYLLKLVFRMMQETDISADDVLRELANFMMGRPVYVAREKVVEYRSLLYDIASNHLQWIFASDTEGNLVLDYQTTVNLLPEINGLSGPKSHGADLRFAEYRIAVDMYNQYTISHEPALLDYLVGILYRKPNTVSADSLFFDGDYREPFNRFHMDVYAQNVKKIPEYLKWGVYMWFSYFCKHLMTKSFIIGGNEVSFAPIFGHNENDNSDTSIGMTSMVFTLADSGTFGNAEQTDKAWLFDVMMKLLHDKQQIDHLKSKQ